MSAREPVRIEIQALRAIAVLTVVVCHYWPAALPGGYVGVDVFFVISGFLISSHLLREIDRTGTVSLPAFWARRARRILPAAFLTLGVCVLGTVVLAGLEQWRPFLSEVRAGTAYVENWHLAGAASDYFAADDAATPVRHFWSLSAEEQFYLVWPVLMVLAVAPWRGRRRLTHRALAVVLGTVTLVSLAFSVRFTALDPAAAYYVTPTRAWEFGAGGLLALAPAGALRPAAAALLSWAGLAAIAAAAVAFGSRTSFPGTAAVLPVAGTLAAIRAGAPAPRWAPTALMRPAPVQFTGDVSYSVYLWHWPLLVFAPLALGHAPSAAVKLVLVALTLLAAWVTKVTVEDPFRTRSVFTRRRPRATYAFVAAVSAGLMLATGAAMAHEQSRLDAARATTRAVLADKPACFGAAARDPQRTCTPPKPAWRVVPSPLEAQKLSNGPCEVAGRLSGQKICAVGAPADAAAATVVLVGDSHTTHWRAGLDVLGRARGWRVLQLAHQGCQFSLATKIMSEPRFSSCIRWKHRVLQWLRAHPRVHLVIQSQLSWGSGVVPTKGRSGWDTAVAGYMGMYRALPASVRHLVVIRDNPRAYTGTLGCVQRAIERRRDPARACAIGRRAAVARDPAATAARRMRSGRFRTVDLTRFFCSARRCFPVVGGALVHQDETHMTAIFDETLGPFLGRAIADVQG
jgi:peptidoglycan/LPS O-acetylase OafA/YrhL